MNSDVLAVIGAAAVSAGVALIRKEYDIGYGIFAFGLVLLAW